MRARRRWSRAWPRRSPSAAARCACCASRAASSCPSASASSCAIPRTPTAPRAEALLFAAARAQLVAELIEPLLAAGEWVLLDRFVDSSLAYQGAGRALGIEDVRAINAFATGGLRPDRTILLRIDARDALARTSRRGDGADRLEREDAAFFAAAGDAYDALAAAEPDRIAVVDAAAAPERVLAAALSALQPLLA